MLVELALESQSKDSTKNTLQEIVESFSFHKISSWYLVLPSIFATLSSILLAYGYAQLLRAGSIAEDVLAPYQLMPALQPLAWGIISLLGYTIAAMISIFFVLREVREHLYSSSITIHYFTGGSSVEGATQYLRSVLVQSTLPSPITGFFIIFLTAGLAYPLILCIIERALREHAAYEECALFKARITREYRGVSIVLDIILTLFTFGIYTAYLGYRSSRTFNFHIDTIHSSHPSPPKHTIHEVIIQQREISEGLISGLILIALGAHVLLTYIGLLSSIHIVLALGIALSTFAQLRKGKSAIITIILIFTLLYSVIIGGILSGVVGYEIYISVPDILSKNFENLYQMSTAQLALYLFINNFVISLPAIIPYVGGSLLTYGTHNAGLIIGVVIASGTKNPLASLSVLIYPHAVLEVLSYALLLSASSHFGNWDRFLKTIVAGVVILFLAAVVEAFTVALL